MYGSFLYNCWSALVGFTVYFVLALQNQFAAPIGIMIGSFLAAIGAFILMFPVRYLLNFILFTPEPVTITLDQEQPIAQEEQKIVNQSVLNQSNTVEFEDKNTEDIAKVVRTMMHQDSETRAVS